jgi:hypothetical protein
MSGKAACTDWISIEAAYRASHVAIRCRAGQNSVRDIAVKYGVSHAAVYNRIKRDGWQRGVVESRPRPMVPRLPHEPIIAEWVTRAGTCPCDGCTFQRACAAEHLACSRFALFVAGATSRRWSNASAPPTKACYAAVFTEEFA